jgi:primosomal protein N' (replication factor Y)
MARLFENIEDPAAPAVSGRAVGVAVSANVWSDYDYLWPDALGEPFRSQRVRVPFGRGNRTVLGFVTDTLRRGGERRLKAVAETLDDRPQLTDAMWRLAEWISHYYLTPLGMTLAGCVPSAVGRHGPATETVVALAAERADWPARLGAKQRKVLDELFEARKQGVEPLGLEELLRHSGASRDCIRRLRKHELIRTDTRPAALETLQAQVQADPFELNAEQKAMLAALEPKLTADAFSATLLHGVTGSGKTEIYVRAIRRVVGAGRQAILLTPEIALATQTLQRLLQRLPCVVVLHSGLTDAQRALAWEQIRAGRADVVVGPRSAIFAPAPRLGLVIVDEEHESGYKQDTAPRYHGRDVAVKRAALEAVPVVLGSATPSMESLHNARQGRYDLLRLRRRVRGLAMPKLQIVHLRRDMRPGRIELLGETLTARMAAALDRDEQVILLMNRRGYASYVFCPTCRWMMECDNCIRPMVFHQAIRLCVCHHCDHTASLPEGCPACGGKLLLFGYGIQRIENELARKFPTSRVARMDSDTMTSPKQFQKVLAEFGAGEIDILLGTQMVGKGLDFPRVSLVGVVSADTSLALHDFRAAERTFQLVVQVAGRAGRGETPGEVVVQTLHPDEPAIRFAETHDFDGFAEHELSDRAEAGMPPMTRLTRFIVRHEKMDHAEAGAAELARAVRRLLPADRVTILGPMQAEFAKIRDLFRFHILVFASQPGLVQQRLAPAFGEITHRIRAEILADVDALNLL